MRGARVRDGPDSAPERSRLRARIGRQLNLALGLLALTLGIIGAFVPLLPTTIFLIIAAFFFGRSSERLEAWLLNHPRLGPSVVGWRRERAIGPRAKLMACAGMTIGFAVLHFAVRPGALAEAAAAAFLIGCAAYVLTRPNPSMDQ